MDIPDAVSKQAGHYFSARAERTTDETRQEFEHWIADPIHRAAYEACEWRFNRSSGINLDNVFSSSDKWWSDFFHWPKLGYALAAGAAAAFAIFWFVAARPPALQSDPMIAQNGRVGKEMLSDGSMIQVSDHAQFSKNFGKEYRGIQLQSGTARIEIKADGSRPFIIRTPNCEVRSSKGIIDISVDRGGTQVKLYEGNAIVSSGSAPANGISSPVTAMTPGQTVKLGPRGTTVMSMIEVDGMRLSDVLALANIPTKKPIILGDKILASIQVSGRFDLTDPAKLAQKLAAAFDLDIVESQDSILLNPNKS